jgi:hypothetical protein
VVDEKFILKNGFKTNLNFWVKDQRKNNTENFKLWFPKEKLQITNYFAFCNEEFVKMNTALSLIVRPEKSQITKKLKNQVWSHHHKKNKSATCYVCETTVIYKNNFHCCHIIAKVKGGTLDIENLVTGCQTCNLRMGTENLEDYKSLNYPK